MGGRWISQNKVRPGAYINFNAVSAPTMQVGDRGIGTMAFPMNWGPEGELISVYSTDMTDGTSLAKIGMTAFDEEAKLPNLMLSNCYLGLFYRLDSGGVRATATQGSLTAKAKYAGTKGNMITVAITESDGPFTVTTYVDGVSRDAQTASTVQELVNNDYVEFSGFGALAINAGITLTGGTNGTVTPATAYPAYLALARKARWQTMALTRDNDTFAAQFAKFAEEMRDTEGKYVQVVVANYDAADYHGVINSDCGVMMGNVEVTAEEATAWVAGITAGASVTESAGSQAFAGATRILNTRTNSEYEEALQHGMFVLRTNIDGQIVPEKDINSLHTFTSKLSKDFRLNQVIRVLDEVGTRLTDTWERSYRDKIQNNENGRNVFKSDVLTYLNELQRIGAIDNFEGADDIEISAGKEKTSVMLTINRLNPIAAMDTLYALVYVI